VSNGRRCGWADGSRERVRPLETDQPEGRAPVVSAGRVAGRLPLDPAASGRWKADAAGAAASRTRPPTSGCCHSRVARRFPWPARTSPMAASSTTVSTAAWPSRRRQASRLRRRRRQGPADARRDRSRRPRRPPRPGARATPVTARPISGSPTGGASGRWAASRIRRLTNDAFWYGDPQWSPDGATLAFVHPTAPPSRSRCATASTITSTCGPSTPPPPNAAVDARRRAGVSAALRAGRPTAGLLERAALRLASRRVQPSPSSTGREEGAAPARAVQTITGPTPARPPHPAPAFPLPRDCCRRTVRLVYNAETGTTTQLVRLDLKNGKGEVLNLAEAKDEPGTEARVAGAASAAQRQLTAAGQPLPARAAVGGAEGGALEERRGRRGRGRTDHAARRRGQSAVPTGRPSARRAPQPIDARFDFHGSSVRAHGYAVFQPNFRGKRRLRSEVGSMPTAGDFGGANMRDILDWRR